MKVYFATNRNHEGNADFGIEREKGYLTGRFDVVTADDPGKSKITQRHLYSTNPKNPGTNTLFQDMEKDLKSGSYAQDILVYIHGFDFDFDEAIQWAGSVGSKYLINRALYENVSEEETYELIRKGKKCKQPLAVAFSWPSAGSKTCSHTRDREYAQNSGEYMAEFLREMSKFVEELNEGNKDEPEKEIRLHILAHSMGNFALCYGLYNLDQEHPAVKFDNVFLMAADVNRRALTQETRLKLLPKIAKQIHVYHCETDGDLMLSDVYHLSRMGRRGPETLNGLKNVYAIDCNKTNDSDFDHRKHRYYLYSNRVIADACCLLSGLDPEEIPNREHSKGARKYAIR